MVPAISAEPEGPDISKLYALSLEMGMSVGVVDVLDNFRGIEQDHDIVRENTDSVDAELFL